MNSIGCLLFKNSTASTNLQGSRQQFNNAFQLLESTLFNNFNADESLKQSIKSQSILQNFSKFQALKQTIHYNLACVQQLLGNYSNAYTIYKQLLSNTKVFINTKHNSFSSLANQGLARLAIKRGDFYKALSLAANAFQNGKQIKALIGQNGSNRQEFEDYQSDQGGFNLDDQFQHLNDLQDQATQRTYESLLFLGWIEFKRGDYQASQNNFKQIIQNQSKDFDDDGVEVQEDQDDNFLEDQQKFTELTPATTHRKDYYLNMQEIRKYLHSIIYGNGQGVRKLFPSTSSSSSKNKQPKSTSSSYSFALMALGCIKYQMSCRLRSQPPKQLQFLRRSIQYTLKALQSNPSNFLAANNLACNFAEFGKIQQANKIFQQLSLIQKQNDFQLISDINRCLLSIVCSSSNNNNNARNDCIHQILLLKSLCKKYKELCCEPTEYKAIDMLIVSALTRVSVLNKTANIVMTQEMVQNSKNTLTEAEKIVKSMLIQHPGQADILYNQANILLNLGQIVMENPQKGRQYDQTYKAIGYIKHSRDIFASLHTKIEKEDIRLRKITPAYKLKSSKSAKFLNASLLQIQQAAANKFKTTKLICDHSGEKLQNARVLEDQDRTRMEKSKKRSQELKQSRNQIQKRKQLELQEEKKKMQLREEQNQRELDKMLQQWKKDMDEKKDKEKRQVGKKKRGGKGKKGYEDDGFIQDGDSDDDDDDGDYNYADDDNYKDSSNNKHTKRRKHNNNDNLSDSQSLDSLFDDQQNQKKDSDNQDLDAQFEFNPEREKERREQRARRKKELKKQKRAEQNKRLKREKKSKDKSTNKKVKKNTSLMETAMDIPDEELDIDQIFNEIDQQGNRNDVDDESNKKANVIQDDEDDE